MKEGWNKIEEGWYEHKSGAIVQHWPKGYPSGTRKNIGWHVWKAGAKKDHYTVHTTMLKAMAAALGGER